MSAHAYQRIKEYILDRVHGGHWREGDQVPSEHELLRRFRVSRMTVNRALRELTAEQVLTRVKGSGTFVARPKYASTLVAIRSIAQEIEARGHKHTCDVLSVERIKAGSEFAAQFELNGRAPLFHSRLLHREDDVPIQVEERWVNAPLAPDYDRFHARHAQRVPDGRGAAAAG
jgi:GntR family histidine utilization transcriptional repressor